MLMVASFLANTILNFVLGLAVAGLLGSAEYGRYSVAATIAAIASLAAFEWLRVSTTRSYSRDAHDERPAILASLKLGYLGGSAAILAATAVALALGADFGLGGALVAAAAMASLATGYFDFAGARLRAVRGPRLCPADPRQERHRAGHHAGGGGPVPLGLSRSGDAGAQFPGVDPPRAGRSPRPRDEIARRLPFQPSRLCRLRHAGSARQRRLSGHCADQPRRGRHA